MMLVLGLVAALSAVANAAAPTWSLDTCGISKYADAGERQPLPGGGLKIVGGIEALPNELPWTTSVQRASTNGHFCGGSIINKRWILTAGHCMQGEVPNRVQLSVGDHTRSAASSTRQVLAVSRIIVHPNYNSNTLENDVALVQTSTDIVFNENVAPVCAPDDADQLAYRLSQCAGWGTLRSGGACCPDTLQVVTLNVTTNTYCNSAYPQYAITNDMICATDNTGSRDRDSCQGDSGGPLTVKTSGVFSIAGVVSWGIGCASGYPGVYARVSYFNNWISSNIDIV